MAATGYLSVAAVLLTVACMTKPALSQDVVPPQLFGCSVVDIAGTPVSTTAQTSTGTWQTPSGFNLQPGQSFTTPFETANIYGQLSGTTPFNYGFTTVGYRFVDNPPTSPPQNNAYCTFFVRVGVNNDGTIPTVLNCPGSITQPIASSQTTAAVSWTEPTATDNNGVVRRSWRSHAPNTAFPVGTTQVTYQWIDPSNANSQAQCMFTVTVSTTGTDGVVPSLTCPADVVASAGGIATWTPPTPTDASGIVSTTSTLTPGSVVQEGFTTVTYNTVDGTGNRASCSFIVRRIPSDQYSPVITSCPTNIDQTVTSGTSGFVTWTEPTAYDDGGHVRLVMQTHSPNTAFPVGTTPVEYRFQDTREQVARCVFTVVITVTGGDTTPPTFTNCPTTSQVFTITSGSTAFVSWAVPQATDNQGTPTVTQIQGVSPGTNLAAGQYTIRYQAQDAAGNNAFCMFTVLVQQGGDTTPPTFTNCPTTSQVFTITSGSTAFVSWAVPQATDNQGTPTVTQIQGVSPGTNLAAGQYTIRYQAQDAAGNNAFCMFTVLVQQAAIFEITCRASLDIITSTAQTIQLEQPLVSGNTGAVTFVYTAISGGTTVPVTNNMVTVGSPSSTNVFIVGTDTQSGRTDSCSYTITVGAGDTTPPSIFCPTVADVTVSTGNNNGATVTWATPQASDNSGTPTVALFPPTQSGPGSFFVFGSYTITYRATDAVGLTADCSVTFSVVDRVNPVPNCPANIMQAIGVNQNIVTWPTPSGSDNSQVTPTIARTSGPPSGSTFTPGTTTTIVYTATDQAGNSGTCSFTVQITGDTTPPSIFCPTVADVTVSTGNNNGATVNWATPPAFDDIGTPTVALFPPTQNGPGSFFVFGSYTITYRATNAAGLTTDCSVTFSVVDRVNPVPNCPANIMQAIGVNQNIVTWPTPSGSDNSQVTPTIARTSGPPSGSTFTPGTTTTIVYTATDQAGNSGTCSFTVQITGDTTPPSIFCPTVADVTVSTGNNNGATVNWATPPAFDDIGTPTVALFPPTQNGPGSFFVFGSYTITYRATNAAGLTTDCSVTFSVVDRVNPVPNCPANIMQAIGVNQNIVTWPTPSGSDNSQVTPTIARTSGPPSGSTFTPGTTTTIVYTATDQAGNSGTCSFTVQITGDTTPPSIFCPTVADVTVSTGNNNGATVNWATPPAFDDIGTPTVALFPPTQNGPGSFFVFGSYTITYRATNAAGLTTDCSVTFSVVDRVNPVPNCPANIMQAIGVNQNIVTWPTPSGSDNSQVTPTIAQTSGPTSGSTFTPGTTTTIVYTATDQAGNSGTCSFTVQITGDTTPPSIFCPTVADVTVSTGNDNGATVNWATPPAFDDFGTPTVALFPPTQNGPGSFFVFGSYTITYRATNAAGLTTDCSVTFSVVDRVNPVPNCPANIMQAIGVNQNIVTWPTPSGSDNSQVTPTIAQTSGPTSGSTFTPGTTTTIVYTATDQAGNSGTCSFTVQITGDTTPPSIFCPTVADVTVSTGNDNGATVNWATPPAFDDFGTPTVALFPNTQNGPGSFFVFGSYTITYRATNAAGLTTDCSVTFSVVDRVNPVPNCPANIMQAIGVNQNIVTWPTPSGSDNSQVTPTITQTSGPTSGSTFTPGTTTTIVYTATDQAGNSGTCSFTVQITGDTTPPQIFCPTVADVLVSTGTDNGATVNWATPQAFDDFGTPTVALFPNTQNGPGSFFVFGSYAITYRATNAAGLTADCDVTFSVVDRVPPVITCPINVQQEAGINGNRVVWTPATATDNTLLTPTVTKVQGPDSGSVFTPGTTTVIVYTATDVNGNSASCTFSVEITNDVTSPTITCPVVPDVVINTGTADGATVNWATPSAFDNNGVPTVALFPPGQSGPGTFFRFGSYSITYRATDQAGNIADCTITFAVVDRVPPVFVCPTTPVTETIPVGSNQVVIQFPTPTATDNSGFPPTVRLQDGSQGPGQPYGPGTFTVTYVATDGAGNEALCSFPVTVQPGVDITPPVVTVCPANIVRTVELGSGDTVQVTWDLPTATDDSGSPVNVVLQTGLAPGSSFSAGVYEIVYRISDNSGNFVNCEFCVVVNTVDRMNPSITCPADITRTVELGTASGSLVSWQQPTVGDSSGGPVFVTLLTDRPSGSYFPAGAPIVVSYQAADVTGNTDTCSFTVTVTVVDTTAPVFTYCPSTIQYSVLDFPAEGILVSWAEPQFYDASNSATISDRTPAAGTRFTNPSTQVSYTVRDAGGRTAVCSFQVNIFVQNPCTVSPCQNGGNCVPTGRGTNDYNCVCPPCFSGQNCQLGVNPCANNMCASGSVCVPVAGSCVDYTCQCSTCNYGRFCDQQVDACANHKCENGGVCSAFGSSCLQYSCACSGCFRGATCNEVFNPCSASPCQNSGVCSAVQNSCTAYSCRCLGCFTGYNCQLAVPSLCLPNPCQNNGVCMLRANTCYDYVCQCSSGFTGLHCEAIIMRSNPCNSFPCLNGADCINMDGDFAYTCKCQSGYTGINCGVSISDVGAASACASNPCQSGSTCSNSYHSSSPQIYQAQYVCNCNTFLTGMNCNTPTTNAPTMNVCGSLPRPCANGGTCNNIYNSYLQSVDYWCRCQPSFFGQHCEIPYANPCVPNPCLNGGTCSSSDRSFTCQCAAGFSGNLCETQAGDTTPPQVFNCPSDFAFDAGSQSVVNVPWTEPQVFGGTLFYQTHTPNSTPFQTGTSTRVIYVFADAAGNLAKCSFNVLVTGSAVTDNSMPSITCPNAPTAIISGDATTVRVTWSPPIASDNQGPPLVSSDRLSGSPFPEGMTPVTYTATDYSGNRATCTFQVTVTRQGGFTVQCPNPVSIPADAGQDCTTYTLPNPTYSNNVGAVTLGYRLIGGSATGQNFYTTLPFSGSFRYRAVDSNGNVAECTFVLSITPGVDPCSPNPCQNGGQCSVAVNTFSCQCPTGFTGTTCENPTGGFQITCQPQVSVSGTPNSPVNVNIPEPTAFGNTGQVFYTFVANNVQISNPRAYQVTAPASGQFTVPVSVTAFDSGTNQQRTCQINIVVTAAGVTPCAINPCQNGGTCNVNGNTFSCTCAGGFSGTTCTIPPTGFQITCQAPVSVSGTPGSTVTVQLPEPTATGNTGTVTFFFFADGVQVNSPMMYQASVPASGQTTVNLQIYGVDSATSQTTNCMTQVIVTGGGVSPCASGPCLNGGTCNVQGQAWTCTCPTGFSGSNCQLDPCSVAPCLNGGVCSVNGNTFSCACQNGFTGDICQTAPGGFQITCQPQVSVSGTPNSPVSVNIPQPTASGNTGQVFYTYRVNNVQISNPRAYQVTAPASGQSTVPVSVTAFEAGTNQQRTCQINIVVTASGVNPCAINPCQNGGTCNVNGNTFSCICAGGFSGSTCTIPPTGFQITCQAPVTVSGTPGSTITVQLPEPTATGNTGTVAFFFFADGAQVNSPMMYQASVPAFAGQSNTVSVLIYGRDSVTGTTRDCMTDVIVTASGSTNPCTINPCQNGGTCSVNGNTFSCTCAAGFSGTTCTIPTTGFQITCQPQVSVSGTPGSAVSVNIPEPTASGNTQQVFYTYVANNVQISTPRSYQVIVPASGQSTVPVSVTAFQSGTTQQRTCQINIVVTAVAGGPCNPSPCQNGGTCNVVGTSFMCTCTSAWVESICATPNPCNSNPCPAVDMECYYAQNSYVCGPAQTGRRRRDAAEGDVSLCDQYPCFNNGTCVSGVDEEIGDYMRCDCAPGWVGPSCEQEQVELDQPDRPSWMIQQPPDWMDHSPARWGKEKLGMHWMMVGVIAILALVVVLMACAFMRLTPRKRSRFDGVKLIH
ncbi:mucin-19-like isoform X4 [Patiria miniata]|uniref:Hyalin n=1 Tax=Patiria miniata TaxID=46514 RepID=A0A914ATU2_PATMI|nr:mucin-19-like isoform X4 [Patiria miniata]